MIRTSAPSNIALIKYMGKNSTDSNLPTNASFSYTLEHLRSFVEIEPAKDTRMSESGKDTWEPLPGYPAIFLSETGLRKFLSHFERLKKRWEISGTFTLRSANNFPSDCGLASSASSFAALTLATAELAKLQNRPELSPLELSALSRFGSGSSCRSIFSPWALWKGEGAEAVDLDLQLDHAVVIVENSKKEVSSSQAHVRVSSSLLFQGRPERAEKRLSDLLSALREGDWQRSFQLCWSEFWDMHCLFETSQPAFGYMTAGTFQVLQQARSWWASGDGPLVTMDAGANVHLLFRREQRVQANNWLRGLEVVKSWE